MKILKPESTTEYWKSSSTNEYLLCKCKPNIFEVNKLDYRIFIPVEWTNCKKCLDVVILEIVRFNGKETYKVSPH